MAESPDQVLGDPIENLQDSVVRLLTEAEPESNPLPYGQISVKARWRPHLFQVNTKRGWYFHPFAPETDSWARRSLAAQEADPALRIGVAAESATLESPDFLVTCANLDAAVIVLRPKRGKLVAEEYYPSYAEFICERRLTLPQASARDILDISLARALAEGDDQRKGVLLEVVCALLMSQVNGFETRAKGVANRSQQMDVMVHSKVASGILSGSPIVLVEARNWPKRPVTPKDYRDFRLKIASRHKRCSLGFLVTTGRFTKNVSSERLRHSENEIAIALIDGKTLPRIWRGKRGITEEIEDLVVASVLGE